MATIGQINVGMALDATDFGRGLTRVRTDVAGFGTDITRVGNLTRNLFAGLATAGASAALYGMAKSAADLEDSLATVDAVFGSSADKVAEQADAMAKAYGLVKRESLGVAGSMGAMFRGSGFDSDSAAEYANTLSRLAVDYTAAFGGTVPEALDRIASGLRGEVDPLEKFGVSMSAANVEAKALAMGFTKVGGAFSTMETIQARAALILDQSKTVIGQAAAQADGAAMTIGALSGRFEELTTTIGGTFAGAVGNAIGGVNTGILAMDMAWRDLAGSSVGWVSPLLESLGAADGGINALEVGIGGLANGFQVVGVEFKTVQGVILSSVAGMVDAIATVTTAFDTASESITGWSSGVGDSLSVMADSMKIDAAEFTKELDAMKLDPWASNGVSSYFQEAREKVDRLRAELASKPMSLPIVAAAERAASNEPAKVARSSGSPFAPAAMFGSREWGSTILRSRFGGSGTGDAAATAKNTKDTVAALNTLPARIGDALGKSLVGLVSPGIDWK